MLILGLNGNFGTAAADLVPGMPDYYFHDAAACLIKDGKLVAAVEEERLNRIKKTTKFPVNAVRACLDVAKAAPSDIDAVGYYFDEEFTDHALNSWYLDHPRVPNRGSRQLIDDLLRAELDWAPAEDKLLYTPHHLSHAYSSFVRSGFDEALVVVLDARGEEDSGTIYRGHAGGLEPLSTYPIAQSLGTLYEAAIHLVGYRFGDEYKVMGLAPYGNPETYRELFKSLYTLGENGEYTLNPAAPEINMVGPVFFSSGFLPRRKGEELTQAHMDFAAGLQETLETIVLHVLGHWAKTAGLPKLCFTGGVAHNSTLNGLILKSGLFEEVFIHPSSHDAGAAEGAALAAGHRLGENPFGQPQLRCASLGPALGDSYGIEKTLKAWSALIDFERPADIVDTAADLLAKDAVLGWTHGGSEFGPRALGNRSIIADARPAENRHKINAMVKKREGYRPFAPVVTREAAGEYFDLPATTANYDFMSYVIDVREEHREHLGAITHVDGSARLQIVDPVSNRRFHDLVERFGAITGTPVLLNTSFNNNAEPIVQSVEDALTSFLTTDLDYLVVEDYLISRRPGGTRAFDDFVVGFRPVTRLARNVHRGAAGEREVVHEIFLDYATGPRAEVSPELFSLLEGTDGQKTLATLAQDSGVALSDEIREEIFALWHIRYFTLTPSAT
ncbi:carbamoyltransferase C-terminal domain-containing protein [Amycolatopsis sp. NPDC051716]|jgi:predicted NodU family carbamoyl transferase|uniref:carbamoyltransferase family protein n=1 Tax=Amycolatopsis sp. NPDC051716 TaxID=3155804 RepID=UPI003420BF1D